METFGVSFVVVMRYESIYLQRILRSNTKWAGKRVRLLRDARTKAGVQFSKGEILEAYAVSKPGCVDIGDHSRFIIGIPFRDVELVEVFEVREKVLETLRGSAGRGFTLAELSRRVEAKPHQVRKALARLAKLRVLQIATVRKGDLKNKAYHWVLPRPSSGTWFREEPLTAWERLVTEAQ